VDSVWAQPIAAIENPAEMDLTRVELARLMASAYRSDYEALFGPLPELDDAPQRAKPGMAAWDALPEVVQQDVDRVSANVGKAIEAYERQLLCSDTKFARGEEALSQREERGAQAFVQGGCVNCHSGPAFSDGKFHNIGLPSTDPGRSVGRTQLLANVFNGVGLFSDDPVAGQHKLTAAQAEGATVGAFKTPSLRGVGQRTFFGHASHQQTLAGFVQDVYRGGRGRRNATIGTLDPLLRGVNVPGNEVDDLVEFLHTLDCPPVPSHLVVR
jgi:cytochrome c peroxidase